MLDQAEREIGESFDRVEHAVRAKNLGFTRSTLLKAASTEERHIERLERVRSLMDSHQPLRALLIGARAQVADVRQLARSKRSTLKRARDEIERTDEADRRIEQALIQLEKLEYVSPKHRRWP